MSVTVPPGATALTVIFLSPASFAKMRTNVSTAALEPEYSECLGTLNSLAVLDDMRMMRPPALRWRYASRATKNCARVLMLKTRSNSSCRRHAISFSHCCRSCFSRVVAVQGNAYLGHIAHVPKTHDPGVAAHDVEPAEMPHRIGHQLGRLRHLADVGLEGDRVGPQALDLRHDPLRRFPRAGVIDDHPGAAAAEVDGHGGADATAGAGDEGDFAIEAVGDVRGGHWVRAGGEELCCEVKNKDWERCSGNCSFGHSLSDAVN